MRNKEYEKKFRAYLFKGDLNRFRDICQSIGVYDNLNCLKEVSK